MTDLELENLSKLAKAATPGPWEPNEDGKRCTLLPNFNIEACERATHDGDPVQICENLKGKNAAFISAANPETVQALIALVREKDARIAGLTYDWRLMREALNRVDFFTRETPGLPDGVIQQVRLTLASLQVKGDA